MKENIKTPLVVNLISGPGAGKSTAAAGIFHALKKRGLNAEMALEFAKDKVYEESFRTMDNQIYIFGKQYHKLWRLKDKVDIIITDSPLPISLYYHKNDSKYFKDFVVEQYNNFNNLMYFIRRSDIFQQEGRIQNREESEQIDKEIKNLLETYGIEYREVSQENALDEILKEILEYFDI